MFWLKVQFLKIEAIGRGETGVFSDLLSFDRGRIFLVFG